MLRKPPKKKKKQSPLVGTSKGQEGRFRISGSRLDVTRTPDRIVVKRPPKKQKVIYE